MGQAEEIIKAVLSPANKLIDAVSGAIGKIYEPIHKKRMADASAYEIDTISRALRDNADIPITYNNNVITEDTQDYDNFVKRTQSRLAFQELQKQQNIENVTDQAYAILENETECSAEPVQQDWMIRFFNSVEDISDKDMQTLWARILAGEIKQPQTFSLRTLDAMRNLSKSEAELFEYICRIAACSDDDNFIISDEQLWESYDVKLDDILHLGECGLVTINDLKKYFEVDADKYKHKLFWNNNIYITAQNCSKNVKEIKFVAHPITRIGMQIMSLFENRISDDDLLDFARKFRKANKKLIFNAYRFDDVLQQCDLL